MCFTATVAQGQKDVKPWIFITENLAFESQDTVQLYGPRGAGWSGIVLKLNSNEFDGGEYARARASGFTLVLGQLGEDALHTGDIAELDSELTRGSRKGIADWIYIDDIDQYSLAVLNHVHAWLDLQNSGSLKLSCSSSNARWIKSNAQWIDTCIQYLMPYRYTQDTNEYGQFLDATHDEVRSVNLVPILGYEALQMKGHEKTFVRQLGTRGGYTGFLEIAHKYSTEGQIAYYSECAPGDPFKKWRSKLTQYLRQQFYIGIPTREQ